MKLNNNYWLGDEASLLHYVEMEKKIHLTPAQDLQNLSIQIMVDSVQEGGDFGEFSYLVNKVENLAIVNVSGSLVTKNRPYNRMFGMVSYDEIRNAVFSAAEHPEVQGIVLNMDTPGGHASGVSELSDFLTQVDARIKPIYTYAGTTMASGGYWLGSVGREIFASKLATVGSIGVVTVHASYEKMLKDDGIEVTVLRAGEFKALGSPYEKLDEKARSQIESQMNSIYEVFLETVADNRDMTVPVLKKTAAEGRVFVGADSVTVGLVDHITSFDSAIVSISEKVRASSSRQPFRVNSETFTGGADMAGKKKVLTEAAVAAIASGVPEAEVLADPAMVVEGADEGAAEAQAAAPAEEGTGVATPVSEPKGDEAAAATVSESSALFDKMFSKVSDLTVQVANLTAKLSIAEQERDKYKSSETALIKVAVQAINRMQVSLGGMSTKMDDADAATVLEQYNRTYSLFNQRFKVGATAKVPESEDFGASAAPAENQTVSAAVHRLTTSRVNKG